MKQKLRYRHKRKGGGLVDIWPEALASPEEIATTVRYVGSAEHKDHPVHASYSIEPDLRSDASRCDPSVTREEAEAALRDGIRRRCVSHEFEDGFPRYVWARLDGLPHAARLVNSRLGEYKGWPIEENELPLDRQGRLERGAW